MKVKVQQLS